jgi:hypothetical protein
VADVPSGLSLAPPQGTKTKSFWWVISKEFQGGGNPFLFFKAGVEIGFQTVQISRKSLKNDQHISTEGNSCKSDSIVCSACSVIRNEGKMH